MVKMAVETQLLEYLKMETLEKERTKRISPAVQNKQAKAAAGPCESRPGVRARPEQVTKSKKLICSQDPFIDSTILNEHPLCTRN